MQKIRSSVQAWRDAQEMRRTMELTDRFYISEKSGSIFLCIGGTAFAEIPDTKSAANICDRIAEARQAAIKYNDFKLKR